MKDKTKDLLKDDHRVVGFWLLGCAGMVFGAMALGGLLRLKESGPGDTTKPVIWDQISVMSWPSDDKEWEQAYDNYKRSIKDSPETADVSLDQFKSILRLECFYRLWGRTLGLVFFIPLAYFWYRGKLNLSLQRRMLITAALLTYEGIVGWWMVDPWQNPPHVDEYKLVTKLSMAYLLYGIWLWTGLSLLLPKHDYSRVTDIAKFKRLAGVTALSAVLTIMMGAFVAATNSGAIHNTWPLMSGKFFPEHMFDLSPLWKNFTENRVTIQFTHRHIAYLTFFLITLTWFFGRNLPLHRRTKLALNALLLVGSLQAAGGISAVLLKVPESIGSLHQGGALTVATMTLWLLHELRSFPK